MPSRRTEIKEQLSALPKNELVGIIVKLAAKKANYDFLLANYLDKESGEKDLYEEARRDLDSLFIKRYKGFSERLRLANMLSACVKRINEFTGVSKNKKLEADLLLYVLEVPFSLSTNMFGTCFTQYDYRVSLLVRRLINLVVKKLHPDYLIEYKDKLNGYLTILHRTSDFNDFIYNLPQKID
jgi:hypothetical protein